jgi:hypothetical protein
MSQRDTSRDDETPYILKAIDSALVFCAAWTLWKGSHDVDALELNCCEKSKALHAAANSFEDAMRKLIMNKNFIENIFGKELAVIIERAANQILKEQELALSKLSSKH